MSTVSPEQLKSMGEQAQARLASAQPAPEGEATPTEGAPEQTPAQRAYQRYLLGVGGPRSAYQPGGEQLAERQITRELHGQLSPETADALEAANLDQQGLAVGQSESAAQQLEKQARFQSQQAQRAREQLSQYKRVNAAKQAEYDIRQSELDDMRNEVRNNPATYWSDKDTFTKILNVIGLAIMGLDRDSGRMIPQIMQAEVERKQKERGTAISLLQERLNRFKEGLPSPESRQLYEHSLGLEAAAAEADKLANLAKAEDARQRGFSLAEQLRIEALKMQAAAETAPLAKEEIKTKNMPGKWVGGGKSPEEKIIERHKKAGGTGGPMEALANAYGEFGGGGGEPQTPHDLENAKYMRETAVRLPNGDLAHATDKEKAHELQQQIDASHFIQGKYDRLAQIRARVGPSGQWDRELLGEARATVSAIKFKVRELEKNSGGSIRLGEGSESVMGPISGEGIEDWILGPQFEGALKGSREFVNEVQDQARNQLTSTPWGMNYVSTPAGGRGSTFKPHPAPKEP